MTKDHPTDVVVNGANVTVYVSADVMSGRGIEGCVLSEADAVTVVIREIEKDRFTDSDTLEIDAFKARKAVEGNSQSAP